jgi:hypothetical protein
VGVPHSTKKRTKLAALQNNQTTREHKDAIVDCGEPYFTNHYDLFTGDKYRGGDVVEYRVLEI